MLDLIIRMDDTKEKLYQLDGTLTLRPAELLLWACDRDSLSVYGVANTLRLPRLFIVKRLIIIEKKLEVDAYG